MSQVAFGSVLILVFALLAPILARLVARWVRVPIVVFELVLGIAIGPSLLGWVQPAALLDLLSQVGLAMLFFMAGAEIRFAAIAGRPIRRAALGWLISLTAGVVAGVIIAHGEAAVIVGVALCSTALGTVLPILRDAGEMDTRFGVAVTAVGAVGEFGPLVAISLFLGGRNITVTTLVLVTFVAVAALAIWAAMAAPQGRLHGLVNATLHSSGQVAIRIVFVILGTLVAISAVLDLDMLLGAFTAGVVWQLIMRNAAEDDRAAVDSKLEGIAFGLLVPVFFLYTGVTFDAAALFSDGRILVLVPVFVVLLLVIRGMPSVLAAPAGSTRRDRASLVLFGATGLPVIVAVTAIGVDKGIITSGLASAMVGAGMLSVLVFPLVAMRLRGEREIVPAPGAAFETRGP